MTVLPSTFFNKNGWIQKPIQLFKQFCVFAAYYAEN